jgi:hypothetical protein
MGSRMTGIERYCLLTRLESGLRLSQLNQGDSAIVMRVCQGIIQSDRPIVTPERVLIALQSRQGITVVVVQCRVIRL